MWRLLTTALLVVAALPSTQPVASPGPRLGHALVYDERRDRILLFGGAGVDREPAGDTWEWDGRRWRLLTSSGPSPRNWPSMAYDARREEVVLFGGRGPGGRQGPSLADTWRWNGREWRRLDADGPPGRDHAGMVYDRRRDRMVLFGGWDGSATRNDTWELVAGRWQAVDAAGPGRRAAHAMVYDERRQVAWLHGGRDLDVFYDDVWLFDGKQWSRQVAGPGPSARGFQAAFYDPIAAEVLIYGGISPDPLRDMWRWDGSSWHRHDGSTPPARSAYSAAYDRKSRSALLHGGGHRTGETWWIADETWHWTRRDGWRLLVSAAGQPSVQRQNRTRRPPTKAW